MIRIDAMWFAVDPVDMRAGADRLIASVVQVFGTAQAHHGYLFANARGTRMKLVVHDGFGVWCATRRLNQGRFVWPSDGAPLQQRTHAHLHLHAAVISCRGDLTQNVVENPTANARVSMKAAHSKGSRRLNVTDDIVTDHDAG